MFHLPKYKPTSIWLEPNDVGFSKPLRPNHQARFNGLNSSTP